LGKCEPLANALECEGMLVCVLRLNGWLGAERDVMASFVGFDEGRRWGIEVVI
jgi:hypothetical protein